MNRQQLAQLWEEATTLQDGHAGHESPLTKAIFDEALEATEFEHKPREVADALYKVAQDVEDFANLICNKFTVKS